MRKAVNMKHVASGMLSSPIVRPLQLIAALVPIVAMAGSGATRADDPAGPGGAWFELRVLGTGRGFATRQIGGLSLDAVALGRGGQAEAEPWHIQLKFNPPRDGSECSGTNVRLGLAAPSFEGPDAPFLGWDVTGTIRQAETDQIHIEYAWERRTRPGSEQQPRAGRDEVTVKEDDRILLDFVPLPSAEFPAACFQSVALELAASIREDPGQADRRIAYDLWLDSVDRGKRTTQRLRLIGKQGEKVPFDYGTLRSKLEGIPVSEEGSDILETEVKGQVRGRVQANGTIELALFAERGLRPSHHHWGTAAQGEKVVSATAGETLRLELPPPTRVPEDVNGAGEARQAISQHQVSLVLTATPME